ncbi:MAG: hypothetical protein ACOZAN_02495 [Patescibacteria group bacterium]
MTENSLNQHLDARLVSKNVEPHKRAETARQVIDLRQQRDKIANETTVLRQRLGDLLGQLDDLRGLLTEKRQSLSSRSDQLRFKIAEKFGFTDKKTALLQLETDTLEKQADELQSSIHQLGATIETLENALNHLADPRGIVEKHYSEIENIPLSNEQKRDLLKHEALSQLSMEQYIQLWKKLNPHFLSHVTRQGFRDHNAMSYHEGGFNEYHSGFTAIASAQEQMLLPPLRIGPLQTVSEESVKEWMGSLVFQGDESAAYDAFDDLLNYSIAKAPKYPDKTAVHFASEAVVDSHYGGERNNEAFFVFPTDVIVSQHNFAFNGSEETLTNAQSELKWNDVFVWPSNEQNGINLNAGIVFLPKSTQVDRETGSKYLSQIATIDGEQKRVMVEDGQLVGKIIDFCEGIQPGSKLYEQFHALDEQKNYLERQSVLMDLHQSFSDTLIEIGVHPDDSMSLASAIIGAMYYSPTIDREHAIKIINEVNIVKYKRAENTVSAEQYWEDYFSTHENQRPKHIVYYDGDPTEAVLRFQREHGIGKADVPSSDEGKLLGFDDHCIHDMSIDPRSNVGKSEIEELGRKIIHDHYHPQT